MATKKVGVLDIENVVRSLKAYATSIVTFIILLIPYAISYYLSRQGMVAVGMIISLFSFLASLWIYGYLLNRFWGWK